MGHANHVPARHDAARMAGLGAYLASRGVLGAEGLTTLDKQFARILKHASDLFISGKQTRRYLLLGEECDMYVRKAGGTATSSKGIAAISAAVTFVRTASPTPIPPVAPPPLTDPL